MNIVFIGLRKIIVDNISDIITLLSAIVVVSLYLVSNVVLENTLSWKEKIMLLPFVPSMYVFFYILSYVEYYALFKMLVKLPTLKSSIAAQVCRWTHVKRNSRIGFA